MRILIVGRTATGKDTLAKILEEEHGLKQLRSYTNRPRRPGEGDTHVFVETADLPKAGIVAKTKIGPHTYLATTSQFRDADVYVVDPEGLVDLARTCEGPLAVVYLWSPPRLRRERFVARAGMPDEGDAEALFEDRDRAEDARFDAFEEDLSHAKLPHPPVYRSYFVENASDTDMTDIAAAIVRDLKKQPLSA